MDTEYIEYNTDKFVINIYTIITRPNSTIFYFHTITWQQQKEDQQPEGR